MSNMKVLHRSSVIGVLLLVLTGFFGYPVWGFSPTEDIHSVRSTYPQAGRSFTTSPGVNKFSVKKRASQWEEFTKRQGVDWQIRWNEKTGTPARISGGKISTGLNKSSSDKSVQTWAKSFIDNNEQLLGINSTSLRFLDLHRAGGRLYLLYEQIYDGIPVYNSNLKMNIDDRGNLAMLSSSCHPKIEYRPGVKLSPKEAASIAATRIAGTSKDSKPPKHMLKQSQKVIYPMPAGYTEQFRLCYLLKVHLDEPLGDWIVVMDAAQPIEYVRYNNYRFGDLSGYVTGDILPAYYDDTPVTVNFENESIHAYNPTPVYSWSMSSNPGWSTQGDWKWGSPNGVGGDVEDPAPGSGHTGSNVYAYNLSGGYNNRMDSAEYLKTNAIDCSSLTGTHLSFWKWLGVAVSSLDSATIEVSNNNTDWIPIWGNFKSIEIISRGWERVVYDISSVADGHSSVYIRWGMGPTSMEDTYCGWYIDDVEIYANGGTSLVSNTGYYDLNYTGTGSEKIYAELSGPYQNIYYEDGQRLSYEKTVSSGEHNWNWTIPSLAVMNSWNLSTNPGWSTQGSWAFGTPQGNDGDPSSGHTGSSVYGYNLSGPYADNISSPQYLTTSAIDCSLFTGTHLRFWRWLGVESYDRATIEVSSNGTEWTRIYVNEPFVNHIDTNWDQVTYDISLLADGHSNVYIRWGLKSDESENYCGWNIDDIEILAAASSSDVQPGVYDYDEVNLFHHMTLARNSIKNIEPGFTGMDYQVPGIVRVDTDYANAFWDGYGLNFGEGDGVNMRNLALFSDVIYHEYNHGITHQIYPSTMLAYIGESGAMDEAWSDYFACDILDEPLLGEGDLVIGAPYMRNLDNDLRFSSDWQWEVHDDGRIIGGALWDLRTKLGSATANSLIHFSRYNLAETFLDYYEDVLLTDDTNSNLNDGTPNMMDIAEAFGTHGIGGLNIQDLDWQVTSEVYLNDKLDGEERGNLLVSLKGYLIATGAQAALTTTNPYLNISNNVSTLGNFSYGQEKNNSSDIISVSIDSHCPDDEIIEVTLSITADGGYNTEQPLTLINAPDQIIYDDGVADSAFAHSKPGGGFAVRFTPPTYPMTITGVRIWPDTGTEGTIINLCAWDDDGPDGSPGTELTLPRPVTVSGSNSWEDFAIGQTLFEVVYEWNLDSNPGWATQGDWEFGVPTGSGGYGSGSDCFGSPDPTSGFTGSNVYGFDFSGNYSNDISNPEYLTTTPIDCSDLDHVYLRFYRWLGVEHPTYDHASIEVSNNGITWTTVWENYFSVEDNGWQQVTYDISSVAAGKSGVYIRWGMGPTDYSWNYCGWNIDDIQILKARYIDQGITVMSGDVYLGWKQKSDVYYNGVTRKNSDQRSWVYDLAFGWLQLDGEGFVMDMMVRARVEPVRAPSGVDHWKIYE